MKEFRFNPILKKELRTGTRTIRFPLALTIYGGFVAMISLMIMNAMIDSYRRDYYTYQVYGGVMSYNELVTLFLILAGAQAFMISVIIPVLTAGSIAGEREKQTLEILLTAPIKPLQIVKGKLYGAIINVLMYIICTLPAMAISFIYGGISYKYLILFVAAMIVISYAWGAIGIYCSATFKKTITSVVAAMLIELIICFGPLLVLLFYSLSDLIYYGNITPVSFLAGTIMTILLLFSPAVAFGDALIIAATGTSMVKEVLGEFLIKPANPLVGFAVDHWTLLSFITTFLIGSFFVYQAAKKIDAVRTSGVKMRKGKKRR